MISKLDAKKARGGVVAYSSGNHAQGVAAAAAIKGLPALIVMPADTPLIKQENTKSYGAEVVTYDRATQSREAIAERYMKERHAVMVPPFEHPDIIAVLKEAEERKIGTFGGTWHSDFSFLDEPPSLTKVTVVSVASLVTAAE